MANPPPEANIVARSALAALHHDRPILTYGGWTGKSENRLSAAMCSNIDLSSQAPPEIEGHADATWSQTPDLYAYGIGVTFASCLVHHATRKINLSTEGANESSMQNEGVATKRLTDILELANNILVALGTPPDGPIRVSSDNLSNVLISTAGSAATHTQ